MTTAVVGAGPAGLLFAIIARILGEQRGSPPWTLRVFDKRATYVRSHRLRIDEEAFVEVQRDLADERFDRIVEFLREHEFSPEVNLLEAHLERALQQLGVEKELLAIGAGEGEVGIDELCRRLKPARPLTIVAADSVRSTVRGLVCGELRPLVQTHEHVARLRVVGADLPAKLNVVDQVRLSKVLGSLLDYRRNRNGFAEVDLFLTEHEHALVQRLGATPAVPVKLSSSALSAVSAPLFRAVVEHLENDLGGRREVSLHSTFRLEHTVMPRFTFEAPGIDARVFLVGDAAVSLPFFRGMACLVRSAYQLAKVHDELRANPEQPSGTRYDEAVRAIVKNELAVVRARARLVRGVRELFRVSAMLPFPLQSWWLSARELHVERGRASTGFWFNLAAAGTALAAIVSGELGAGGSWLSWLAVPLQLLGGVAYHTTLSFERGPHRWVRRVWQLQIAALFGFGACVTATASLGAGRLTRLLSSTWWLTLAGAFVVGLLLFEALVTRTLQRARLP